MSSQDQNTSQGSSTPNERPSGEPPKRPTSLGRHSSSWINRFHRHHDRKHHRSDDDAERPLLANDQLDEQDEEAQEPSAPPPERVSVLRRFWSDTKKNSMKAYQTSSKFLARNAYYLLIACLLALLTLLISLGIGFFFNHKSHEKPSTCQSAACVHAASEILYNLDPNHAQLDACNQFDQLVCGGWEQRHDLRPDQGDMFTGTIMAENSKTILRHILEQSSSASHSSQADQDNFKKLKDDYDSCMSEPELQKIGLKPLEDVVNQIKLAFPATVNRVRQNPFPTLESAQKGVGLGEIDRLTEALLFLMKLDISAFLTFDVQVSIDPIALSTTGFQSNLRIIHNENIADKFHPG